MVPPGGRSDRGLGYQSHQNQTLEGLQWFWTSFSLRSHRRSCLPVDRNRVVWVGTSRLSVVALSDPFPIPPRRNRSHRGTSVGEVLGAEDSGQGRAGGGSISGPLDVSVRRGMGSGL